jgi:hypothetical protein
MKTRKAVKTKKALKRLDRVEALLSKVIDQYATDEREVRELLESARASVARARVKVKAQEKAKPAGSARGSRGTRLKVAKNKKSHPKPEGKRRPKKVLKSRTSPRSSAPKVTATALEASISSELPDAEPRVAVTSV